MSGKYNIILADPPWQFTKWSDKAHFHVGKHYPCMEEAEICALPVASLAADDCVLFMWATWPNLAEALRVIEAWGFTYKTVAFVWVKENASGWGTKLGMGYWTRSNTEMCLLATRGKPKRISASVRQLIFSPIRQHSRKPDEVHHKIVDLMGDLPRVELFACRPFAGWDVWGNEVESDVQLSVAEQALDIQEIPQA